ncbi:MAG: hypothetical protein ACTHXG_12840, partial [Micrococcaceae bacterium]
MKLFSIRRLLTLGVGAGIGYFAGSREGRRKAEEIARQAQDFWTDPKTQRQVHDVAEKATDVVKEKAPQLGDAAEKAAGFVDKSTGYASDEDAPAADSDTVSDPAESLEGEGGGNPDAPGKH